MKRVSQIVLLFGLLKGFTLLAQDSSGLKISSAVDLTGSFKMNNDSSANDAVQVREAEVVMIAPIDQTFDGLLSFAAHRENGFSIAEIHEAYISSSKLIPRSHVRAGQFFLGIGRLNHSHRHEWPMISAPKVQEQFFGPEGALDSGIQYSFIAPLPFYLQTTFGLTNGWTYGHAHDEGQKPKQATHYARVASYTGLPGDGGVQGALNYLSRTDANDQKMTLKGLDFAAKWRDSGVLTLLVLGELWYRTKKSKDAPVEYTLGAYLIPQYAVDSQVFLGLLIDYYSILKLTDVIGRNIENSHRRIAPVVTYKVSEFSTFRLLFDFSRAQRADQANKIDQKIEFQVTFMMGAHPAHDF